MRMYTSSYCNAPSIPNRIQYSYDGKYSNPHRPAANAYSHRFTNANSHSSEISRRLAPRCFGDYGIA